MSKKESSASLLQPGQAGQSDRYHNQSIRPVQVVGEPGAQGLHTFGLSVEAVHVGERDIGVKSIKRWATTVFSFSVSYTCQANLEY